MNFTERSTTGIEINPAQTDRTKICFGKEAGGIGQGVSHTLVQARGIPCERGPDLVEQFVGVFVSEAGNGAIMMPPLAAMYGGFP